MIYIFVILSKIFFCAGINNLYASVIISDIDDTLKVTNSSLLSESLKSFFYKESIYFPSMKSWFNDLKKASNRNQFYYVSNSFDDLFDTGEWLGLNGFPLGEVSQRDNLYDKILLNTPLDSSEHKILAIEGILKKYSQKEHFIFFGDNAQKDPEIYLSIVNRYKLDADIYIRDVTGKKLFISMLTYKPTENSQIIYYTFDRDLWYDLNLYFQFNQYSLETWLNFYKDTFNKSSLIKTHLSLLTKENSRVLCQKEKDNFKECDFKVQLMVNSAIGKKFRENAPHGSYRIFR